MSGAKGSARRVARRILGLVYKETLQIFRDPSTLVVAFLLPTVLLVLFAYAVSLDFENIRLGVALEAGDAEATELAAAFSASPFLDVRLAHHRRELEPLLVSGELRGFVVVPEGFGERLATGEPAEIQVLTDGSQPNTANFVAGYSEGVLGSWLASRGGTAAPLRLEERIWFNPEIESRRFLLPGAMAIVMTMIGTLLTALVVAREWERGTMEALMSTPAGTLEILVGKLLPYFGLGLLATIVCTLLSVHVFGVPLRGSWGTLLCLAAAFLVPALGQGLLISAVTRNQFVASQLALLSSFLPAFLLSGFLFQIEAMPRWIQLLTHAIPARYFVSSLQTVFLAGEVWEIFRVDILSLLALGTVFFALTTLALRRGL